MPAENQEAFRLIRQHTTTPIAVGEVFNTICDCQQLIARAADRLHPRDRRARGRHHAPAPHRRTSPSSTRCAPAATARPTCRRCAWRAALHFDLGVPNFGIQEYMRAHAGDRRGVPARATASTTATCTPARRRASASTSTRRWPRGTRTARRTCRSNRLEDGTMGTGEHGADVCDRRGAGRARPRPSRSRRRRRAAGFSGDALNAAAAAAAAGRAHRAADPGAPTTNSGTCSCAGDRARHRHLSGAAWCPASTASTSSRADPDGATAVRLRPMGQRGFDALPGDVAPVWTRRRGARRCSGITARRCPRAAAAAVRRPHDARAGSSTTPISAPADSAEQAVALLRELLRWPRWSPLVPRGDRALLGTATADATRTPPWPRLVRSVRRPSR